jgi:O-antigen ligase
MFAFGGLFDVDQWGIAGLIKFRDAELILLLIVGLIDYMARSGRGIPIDRPLRRYLVTIVVTITILWVIYLMATTFSQSLQVSVRYSRQFTVWLLLLVMPTMISTRRDLRFVVGAAVGLIAFTALLFIAQTMSPPQSILRYSQQVTTFGSQVRVWSGTTFSPLYLGGLAILAFVLSGRSRWWHFAIFAICVLAIVSSQARSLVLAFAASMAIGAVLISRDRFSTRPIGLLIVSSVVAGGFVVVVQSLLGRLDDLTGAWALRIQQYQTDILTGSGNIHNRLVMFEYLPNVMANNGANWFSYLFGMGLRALDPAQFLPLLAVSPITPPIWPDNGIAGILFTGGLFGITLFVVLIITLITHARRAAEKATTSLEYSVAMALVIYFAVAPLLMIVTGHFIGNWEEALAVVVGLGLLERGLATAPVKPTEQQTGFSGRPHTFFDSKTMQLHL